MKKLKLLFAILALFVIFNYSIAIVPASEKVERLPDGRLLLEPTNGGGMVVVGDKIYYSTYYTSGIYSIKQNKIISKKVDFDMTNDFEMKKSGGKNLSFRNGYLYGMNPVSRPCVMGEEPSHIIRYDMKGKKERQLTAL